MSDNPHQTHPGILGEEVDPNWDPDEIRLWRQYRESQAVERRAEFVANAAEGARQALTLNASIRADMQAFLAIPAANLTQVQVRDHVRILSQRVAQITQEADGLIHLFATVIPNLSDLLDEV